LLLTFVFFVAFVFALGCRDWLIELGKVYHEKFSFDQERHP